MHQIGSLICNQHGKLMVKMTILLLLCTYDEPGPRSNNHIKGWHNKMKQNCQKKSPMSIEQAATEVTLVP